MESYFIVPWILFFIVIIIGVINLVIGLTYKKWKRIVIAIIFIALGVFFYYLPFLMIMNSMSKALENSYHR